MKHKARNNSKYLKLRFTEWLLCHPRRWRRWRSRFSYMSQSLLPLCPPSSSSPLGCVEQSFAERQSTSGAAAMGPNAAPAQLRGQHHKTHTHGHTHMSPKCFCVAVAPKTLLPLIIYAKRRSGELGVKANSPSTSVKIPSSEVPLKAS